MKRVLIAASILVLVGVFARQQVQTNRLERELAALRAATLLTSDEPTTVNITRPGETVVQRVPMDPAVYDRLSSLEDEIGILARASNYLMDRGQVPLMGAKVGEMMARLNDPNASDKARLEAMKLLRRADAMDEVGVNIAMNWLNSTTNSGSRQNILRGLEGMTNASMQSTLMMFALNDADPEVREQAVDNLGRYIADPSVEAQLWSIMNSDAPRNVREEAMNAMRRGEIPPHRIASLQATALDTNSDMEKRAMALRTLRGNKEAVPRIVASLANQAHNSQDPQLRAEIFGLLDNNPDDSAKVPLVYGLEDPSPAVRQRAADALSAYRDDPAVQDWLAHVAENDADSQVRREASRALEEIRRRRRR